MGTQQLKIKNMNNKTKILIGAAVILAVVAFAALKRPIVLNVQQAQAQPSLGNVSTLTTTTSTCSATTSPTYMIPGAATTTVVIPGGFSQVNTNFFVKSSTTLAILGYNYEVSEDGVDWYDSGTVTSSNATTTLVTMGDFTATLASTTLGTSGFASPTTTILFQTPNTTVYGHQARLKFYPRIGSGALDVCATVFIQRNNGI